MGAPDRGCAPPAPWAGHPLHPWHPTHAQRRPPQPQPQRRAPPPQLQALGPCPDCPGALNSQQLAPNSTGAAPLHNLSTPSAVSPAQPRGCPCPAPNPRSRGAPRSEPPARARGCWGDKGGLGGGWGQEGMRGWGRRAMWRVEGGVGGMRGWGLQGGCGDTGDAEPRWIRTVRGRRMRGAAGGVREELRGARPRPVLPESWRSRSLRSSRSALSERRDRPGMGPGGESAGGPGEGTGGAAAPSRPRQILTEPRRARLKVTANAEGTGGTAAPAAAPERAGPPRNAPTAPGMRRSRHQPRPLGTHPPLPPSPGPPEPTPSELRAPRNAATPRLPR